ncbi:MAG: multicopper oxidase family protein, partial [Alphaproteobacteria bacterium]|nr:multicopper oxidase family protein [Alphaproteobacteria bacterium]
MNQPTRRRFLQAGAAASSFAAGSLLGLRASQATPMLELTAGPARVSLVGDEYPETLVWAFNGRVPGPVIRAVQGDRLRIAVNNKLAEPTTVHWHGLRVPVGMDGVPYLSQPPIEPDTTFVYEFDLPDAGTYWYHPHIDSDEQVGRGLYGALIVEETAPPKVDHDVLWVLDDWRLEQDASIAAFGNMHDASHSGRIGNTATINGEIRNRQTVRAGERIRLRLINAANARTFGLTFRDLDPWVIALDGQPVEPHRLGDSSVVLGAGMRVDLIIDMIGEPGSEALVVDGHYGPDYAYELIRFAYADDPPLSEAAAPAPTFLGANPVAEPNLDSAERHRLVFEGGAMGGMRGAMMGGQMMDMRALAGSGRLWAINGKVPDDVYKEPPLLSAAAGTSHVIEMVNRTAFEHPIHLHGHAFRIITRNGRDDP